MSSANWAFTPPGGDTHPADRTSHPESSTHPETPPRRVMHQFREAEGNLVRERYSSQEQKPLESPPGLNPTTGINFTAVKRPSFQEMVRGIEKMEADIDATRGQRIPGPTDVFKRLTGLETEAEVNADFDREEQEGPDLSWRWIGNRPRPRAQKQDDHECPRCVEAAVKSGEYWCECEEYCGDPVEQQEACLADTADGRCTGVAKVKPELGWWKKLAKLKHERLGDRNQEL